jgi:hypothetical protein
LKVQSKRHRVDTWPTLSTHSLTLNCPTKGFTVQWLNEEAVAGLAALPNLAELRLDYSRFEPAFIAGLPRLRNLRRLSLEHCELTDADAGALSQMAGVEELSPGTQPFERCVCSETL